MGMDLRIFSSVDKAVDADHGFLARLLAQSSFVCKISDMALEPPFLDKLDRSTASIDLLKDLENALLIFGGETSRRNKTRPADR